MSEKPIPSSLAQVLILLLVSGCVSTKPYDTAPKLNDIQDVSGFSQEYRAKVSRLVQRHYQLPEKFWGSGLLAVYGVKLDEKGKIKAVTLKKSSGDSEFDGVIQKTIVQSQPFPVPPSERVGEEILITLAAS